MWRVFYGDGAEIGHEDCAPDAVPAYDVQAIAQADHAPGTGNVGTVVLRGHDWFYWRIDEGAWAGGDLPGLLDLLLARAPICGICQGRRIPLARYEAIVVRALAVGFPAKSGDRRGERA